MSTDLQASIEEYLDLRRAMGYRLVAHDRLLASFADYLGARGEQVITIELALAWACLPQGTNPARHATRLAAVRGLAAYVHAHYPGAAELIPHGLLPARARRGVPYLYTDEEVAALLAAAHRLEPPVRALTTITIISLMASTGLRIGEALALDVADLDPRARTLTVTGKYDKKRHLPIHPSAINALTEYVRRSRQLVGPPADGSLFVTLNATRPQAGNVQAAFRSLTRACGLEPAPGARAPRLHDLRHTFAVNTLLDAHRSGADVDAQIASLATYLGHVSPVSTYWYLTASPQLLELVNERLQAAAQAGGLQ